MQEGWFTRWVIKTRNNVKGFLKRSITKERKKVKCAYFRVITFTTGCVAGALWGHKAWEIAKNWSGR